MTYQTYIPPMINTITYPSLLYIFVSIICLLKCSLTHLLKQFFVITHLRIICQATIHRSRRFFPIDQSMESSLKNSMGNEKISHRIEYRIYGRKSVTHRIFQYIGLWEKIYETDELWPHVKHKSLL